MKFPLGEAPRVLVVEDDMIARQGLVTLLTEQGFRVESSVNGALGWKCMNEKRPDAVVLDLQLPVMDGVELLRRMRAHATLRSVYVIVASGLEDARSRQLAFEAGCNEYVVKPFSLESMAAALTSYFVRHGSMMADRT